MYNIKIGQIPQDSAFILELFKEIHVSLYFMVLNSNTVAQFHFNIFSTYMRYFETRPLITTTYSGTITSLLKVLNLLRPRKTQGLTMKLTGTIHYMNKMDYDKIMLLRV